MSKRDRSRGTRGERRKLHDCRCVRGGKPGPSPHPTPLLTLLTPLQVVVRQVTCRVIALSGAACFKRNRFQSWWSDRVSPASRCLWCVHLQGDLKNQRVLARGTECVCWLEGGRTQVNCSLWRLVCIRAKDNIKERTNWTEWGWTSV